ncbi:MAG: hypothetical protein KC457_07585 [Myxococcales bacterium]|nr:hypothetical protein [Myxococcales bacterium]
MKGTRGGGIARVVSCLLSLALLLPTSLLRAAPPPDESDSPGENTEEPASEEPASEEPASEVDALALFAEGEHKFALADYPGAIESWEQAYPLLDPAQRQELTAMLAEAHKLAYERGNADPEHLHRARDLLQDHLQTLDPGEVEARFSTQALLDELNDEIAVLEAEEEEREAEIEEAEVEAAKAEVTEQLKELDPWTDAERRRYRIYAGVGGSLVGLGVVFLETMTVAMVLGAQADQRGSDAAGKNNIGQVQEIRRQGLAYNRLAWSSGVIGGAALISGTALIVVAISQRQAAMDKLEKKMTRLRPTLGGLELRF